MSVTTWPFWGGMNVFGETEFVVCVCGSGGGGSCSFRYQTLRLIYAKYHKIDVHYH